MKRRLVALLALGTAAVVWPGAARACVVCYGEAGGDLIGGARLATVFMLFLTYGVLFGGAALAVVVRRKHAHGGAPAGQPVPVPGPADPMSVRAGLADDRPPSPRPDDRPFRGVNDGQAARPS